MKRYRYVCTDAGFSCDVQLENDDEEKGRAEAQEHLRTTHPEEAVEEDKVQAILAAGAKQAVV
jgi:predicted small metal-binding protein